MAWHNRLFNAARQDSATRDIEREMAFHVNELVDQLVAGGMSEADARFEARRRFGNRPQLGERVRDVDFARWLDALAADTRYALRALRRSPGFTAVAIISLALGIGANTAIFTVTNAVALRSLPVRNPESLVSLKFAEGNDSFTNPMWEQVRAESTVFSASLAFTSTTFLLSQGGEERRAPGHWVSGSFFNTLGVRAVAGRTLLPADDTRGCAPVAVVGARFAEREFGTVDAAPGKSLPLNGRAFSVVGVIDESFTGLDVGRAADVYVPICGQAVTSGNPAILDARSRWYLSIIGRRRDGVTDNQVNARLAAISRGVLEAVTPQNWNAGDQEQFRKEVFTSVPAGAGISALRVTYGKALFTLMAIVGVVLLIACTNLAQLLLARGAARQREVAVRLAMGVSRSRLARQLLTESLLLALGGAAAGTLFAGWASRFLVSFISTSARPVWLDLSLDLTVLGFTASVATLTGVIFGLAPAWRATRVDPQSVLKAGGRGVAGAELPRHVARPLLALQVALSLMLVTGGALLVGSFRHVVTLDPGFRREGMLLATLDFARLRMKPPELVTTSSNVLAQLREIPGVTQASGSARTPAGSMTWNDFVIVPGLRSTTQADSLLYFNQVTDGYFANMGTPLLKGRDFTSDDIATGRKVAIISALAASRMYGDENPLGRTFQLPNGTSLSDPYEVIGVVADTKYQSLTEKPLATGYFPLGVGDSPFPQLTYELRTGGGSPAVTEQVRRIARDVSPSVSLSLTTMEQQVASSLARPRLLAALSAFFGGLGLLLAIIGLYGSISYSVSRRRNEIGVRMALGAARNGIIAMIGREAAIVVGAGIVVGGLASYAVTGLLAGFLYGVTPTDPALFALSAMLLVAAGLAAGALPAWRASGVNPVDALREE